MSQAWNSWHETHLEQKRLKHLTTKALSMWRNRVSVYAIFRFRGLTKCGLQHESAFTAALPLLYCCFTAALLPLLYCCFTAALLDCSMRCSTSLMMGKNAGYVTSLE
jgi:hypothetical protein